MTNNSQQQHSDVALLLLICNADENALELLYRNYYPRLFRFIGRITWREDLIDEIINDVMFTVWEKAATYNHNCKLSTWIFGIAYNKARQALRNVTQNLEESLDEMDIEHSNFGDYDTDLKKLEMDDFLASAFKVLSPEQRTVLELTYFEGLHYSEIAQLMDCPENTVKTRMHYARKTLAQHLNNQQDILGYSP